MTERLTVSNRLENLKLLQDYIARWARERGFSQNRINALKMVAGKIFRHLVNQAYEPDQPGSITVSLDEKGARVRLMFEDDAPPYNPTSLNTKPPAGANVSSPPLVDLQQLADSLIYYRTADRKNRLVLFFTP
ncbi:MAG: ATP-binding protein [Deltaproteobacteria bacterium]|nr:ATP-binding protein [Deltaproteobacteria bacterium]